MEQSKTISIQRASLINRTVIPINKCCREYLRVLRPLNDSSGIERRICICQTELQVSFSESTIDINEFMPEREMPIELECN